MDDAINANEKNWEMINRLQINPETPLKTKLGYLEEAIREKINSKWHITIKKSIRKEIIGFAEMDALNLYQNLFANDGYFF